MSQKVTDLQKKLPPTVDLSDAINKSIKISKGKKMQDLRTDLKHLKIRKERIIKLIRLQKKEVLDTLTNTPLQTINLNNTKTSSSSDSLQTSKYFTIHSFRKNIEKIRNIKLPFTSTTFSKIGFFLVLLLFLGLLDKILIENSLRNGYQSLLNIRESGTNIQKIEKNIASAGKNFFASKVFSFAISFIDNDQIKNLTHLQNGGENVTKLLDNTIGIYKTANTLISNNKIEEINFITFLEEIEKNKDAIKKHLYSAIIEYDQVKNLPNIELEKKLYTEKKLMRSAYSFLDIFYENYDILKNIFGNTGTRTYAIALQNNDEIRPTGGFTGSFGILTLRNGTIQNFEKKDVYALEWSINKTYTEKLPAPKGLKQITDTFGLRDANYFPEINDSAKQIKTFLTYANIEIDGIIFINQNTIRELLDIIGGVESQKLGHHITAENFSEIISTITEAEVTKEGTLGTPKQGLFDFAGEFYAKLLSQKKYFDYIKVLAKDFQKRDIIFYSFHPEENSLLWKLGINGTLDYNKYFDFNYPVYTSIGGNKTDRYIRYDYEKQITKIDACSYETSLIIYNEHHFTSEDEIRLEELLEHYPETGKTKADIINIQGKGENKSFLRVLVPKNAAITPRQGQVVIEKENYKIVELFTSTIAGKKSNYTINYNIFNADCSEYTYKFYKQPGVGKYDISFLEQGVFTDYKDIPTDFIFNRDKIK